MIWICLDYFILSIFFTGIYLYKDRDLISKMKETDKFKAFCFIFFMWWALIIYDLTLFFVNSVISYK